MTITYADTLGKHNITIPAELVAGAEVPVMSGPQAQGDVGIWPRVTAGRVELDGMVAVPAAGVSVYSTSLKARSRCLLTPRSTVLRGSVRARTG
jgi:hypothetical protein